MPEPIKSSTLQKESELLKEQEKAILDAVRSLKYGSVEVVIHDGRVMEVTKKQRVRFKNEEPETR
jgi:hypothetical protein